MTLLICRTCPRYDRRATGQFARDLTAAIRIDGRDVATRNVQCLGGCPDDSVVAVDGPGMTRVRFTGVTSDDALAIINAALAHQASSTGDPGDWLIPAELTSRISSVTTKRQPADSSDGGRPVPPRHAPPAYRNQPWGRTLRPPGPSGLNPRSAVG
jgi:predicted metal-binding protein